MATQITVTRAGSGYVLSDGGLIASLLGLGKGVATPWQLYASTPHEVAPQLLKLEGLISSVNLLGGAVEHAAVAKELHFKPDAPKGSVTADPKPKPKPITLVGVTLDDLDLLGAHKWRLTNAGITDIGVLCGCTEEELLAKKGIGKALVARVKVGLKKHKMRLAAKVGK